jgi:hypothetical protein
VVPSFCQKYGSWVSFGKHMELCQGFAKNMEKCQVLPKVCNGTKFLSKIWKFYKFCQKYGSWVSFAENMEFRFRGLGFRVTWVFPPKLGFFFGVLK